MISVDPGWRRCAVPISRSRGRPDQGDRADAIGFERMRRRASSAGTRGPRAPIYGFALLRAHLRRPHADMPNGNLLSEAVVQRLPDRHCENDINCEEVSGRRMGASAATTNATSQGRPTDVKAR